MLRGIVSSLLLMLAATSAAQSLFEDAPLEGAWFDPAVTGQGITIEALPGGRQLFVAWFTHAADESGAQRWYTATLTINAATASGPLYQTRGGKLATPPGAAQVQEEVGTMAIDFPDCRTAKVSYALRDGTQSAAGSFTARPARELVAGAPSCGIATKLRWPHAPPGMDDAAYAQLAADVFIPNNFGQHQGGVAARPGDTYFHDGIDLYADNGTPIHALEAGTVRSIENAGDGASTVTVQSDSAPTEGWSYVHIVPPANVVVGARIETGQRVGIVQFVGLAHLHLSRVMQPAAGPDWRFDKLLTVNPLPFFDWPDTEAPLIREGLLFQRDGSDETFGEGVALSGKVDIVAGMRDPGPNARRNFGGMVYGDRHGIAWAEYEIEGQGRVLRRRAFDFNLLKIGRPQPSVWSMTPMARVVYQPILLVDVDTDADRTFNYYLLTHGTGSDRLSLEDAQQAWDTTQFPDGSYRITVRAADAAGNVAAFVDTVEVRND